MAKAEKINCFSIELSEIEVDKLKEVIRDILWTHGIEENVKHSMVECQMCSHVSGYIERLIVKQPKD